MPNAEKYYNEVMSIPLYYGLTDEDVEDVIHAGEKSGSILHEAEIGSDCETWTDSGKRRHETENSRKQYGKKK